MTFGCWGVVDGGNVQAKKRGAPVLLEQLELPAGPVALAAAVIRQAVQDHQGGNLGAGVWLASDHAAPWVRAAGLDDDWRGVLRRRGLLLGDGEYVTALDIDVPDSDSKLYKAILRFRASAESRLVVSALVKAADNCGGDIPAAVGELRNTAAGERLRAWLDGE